MIGIYKITSPSGRVYIGQSWNIPKRFAKYKGGHSHRQRKLHASLSKYGPSAHLFETVAIFRPDVTQSELDHHEQFYMNLYRSQGCDLLNIKEAGSRGRMSEESKRLIGIAFKGRTVSDEARRKISLANKGRKRSDEVKRRIGDIQRGKKKGPHSPEQNERQRQRMLGTHPSVETRKKQSAWQCGRKRPHISESNRRRAAAGTMFFQNHIAPPGADHPRFGKKHSAEALAKMSASHKGFVPSVSHRQAVSLKVKGELNPAAVLTEEKVREIRARYKPYAYPSTRLAKEYKVSKPTILAIIHGRLWKHLLPMEVAA